MIVGLLICREQNARQFHALGRMYSFRDCHTLIVGKEIVSLLGKTLVKTIQCSNSHL
jgi:hypothetical protein